MTADRPESISSGGGETPPLVTTADGLERALFDDNDSGAWNALEADLKDRAAQPPPRPLTSVGKFAILDELGRGGFGIVYLARDTALGRLVALKVPRPDIVVSAELRRRFLREARASAALDHSNIVPLLEAGEAGPYLYLASTYCPGPTLAAWLHVRRDDPVPARQAAKLVATVAGAAQHAHDRGILHRDIKPSNIILDADHPGADPVPRLTDFGLAKLAGASLAGGDDAGPCETRSGGWLGSPPYMAPEQAAGRVHAIGPATDVYAIGATLYELLTGRPPFQGPTPAETIRLSLDAEPIRPRILRPWLPRDLETVCLKCLEKDPARRYASAGALSDDLKRYLADEPILARPPSPWVRIRSRIRRHPIVSSYVVVALLAVASLVAAALWSNDWLRRHNRVLTREIARADKNARIATEQRRLADRHLFAAKLRLARQVLAAGEPERAQEILRDAATDPAGRDARSFAWRLLRREARREVVQLFERELRSDELSDSRPAVRGADGGGNRPWDLCTLALTPDGRTLATADNGGQVKLWDLKEQRLRSSLSSLATLTERLVFSPDGRRLAAAQLKGSVQAGAHVASVWDSESGDLLARLEFGPLLPWAPFGFLADGRLLGTVSSAAREMGVLCVWNYGLHGQRATSVWSCPVEGAAAFGTDGRSVLVGGKDGLVFLDPQTGTALRRLAVPTKALRSLTLAPDGRWLACASWDEEPTRIWDLLEDSQAAECPDNHATAMTFAPGRSALATVNSNGVATLYDLSSGRTTVLDPGQTEILGDSPVAISPGGATLAVGSKRGVTLWDLAAHRQIAMFPGRIEPEQHVRLAFNADGRSLFVTGGPRVRLWRLEPDQGPAFPLAGHADEAWSVAFSPDGRVLASGSDDTDTTETIKLWDTATGKLLFAWKGHLATVSALAFSPSGDALASGSLEDANNITLWDASTRQPRAVLAGHANGTRTLAYRHDGRELASGGRDGMVRIWNPDTGRPSRVLAGHSNYVRAVAYSPDGRQLASASEDSTARLWDLASGRTLFTFHHRWQVTAVAFSPDGRTLASADERGSIILWDTQSHERLRTIRAGHAELLCLAFAPDGQTLAASGVGGAVRLWDPETGEELHVLEGHRAKVNGLAFSPDGSRMASCDHAGKVIVWRGDDVE